MKEVRFTVPGSPVGYYAEGRKPNWTRKAAYIAYKRMVQFCAVEAGLELPLKATPERPLIIDVVPYFSSGVHCDPENVRKGVSDALFYAGSGQAKGNGDKYTGGSFPPPRYDQARPRVEVTVRAAEACRRGA